MLIFSSECYWYVWNFDFWLKIHIENSCTTEEDWLLATKHLMYIVELIYAVVHRETTFT